MGSSSECAEGRRRVRLVVFSITAEWGRLREVLRAEQEDETICAVTPNFLFPSERERMARENPRVQVFRTFHDLLEREDMEFCDAEADRRVLSRGEGREGRVEEYYGEIMQLKNQRAARRLAEEFEVRGGVLLSGDLGIAPDVWLELGLLDRRVPAAAAEEASVGAKLRRWLSNPVRFHVLEWNEERWLLVGRPERVAQYLDRTVIKLRELGRGWTWWFNVQMKLVLKLRLPSSVVRPILRVVNAPWAMRHRSLRYVAATVHEDNVAVARLAEGLGFDYVNLQDSFLPSYYPSRYLLYRPAVRLFFVWDNFSRGLFERHGLESARWEAFKAWTLPTIGRAPTPVRRILYLSSGAGDWTALKNRSDEDLALALLAEVARVRPEMEIRYRPHPLWLHPEHQGMNSIERAVELVEEMGLPNLFVSQGARKDGRSFSLSGNLSSVSSSMEEDVDWAELVIGEHSQTILVGAQRGKLVVGLNVSKHPAYFGDYARIGFPLVSAAGELLSVIEQLSRAETAELLLDKYNEAIVRHNRENVDGPAERMRG